ncbi:MAG: hypothetical protein HOL98_13770 [Gammaproteobacteria bacterium]|jgi:acyl dehydratase|nr:hypothetical protein [Gammaproteobacteria bacterium]MBT5204520.1 hypothetical protein [Gammaproteobacteria bacterium]MBT5602349.1 hypothetical protein [Gammaproteobacteria bacterium]MBT6247262.1 hypothetical protein [Gammaproteobacteria bacterium]
MTTRKSLLLANAKEFIGSSLGISQWVSIDQVQVNIFGEVSRWRKPGHCDPESAQKGPYGGTLIHGFHMVSLLSHFFEDAVSKPQDASHSLNYGLDKVRILQPVVIGQGVKLRSHVSLLAVTDKSDGQVLLKTCHQIEAQGLDDYVMYAEYLAYWFPESD